MLPQDFHRESSFVEKSVEIRFGKSETALILNNMYNLD